MIYFRSFEKPGFIIDIVQGLDALALPFSGWLRSLGFACLAAHVACLSAVAGVVLRAACVQI